MALDATALGTAIKDALTADGFDLTNAPKTARLAEIFATETINHFKANAVISTTVPAAGLLDSVPAPCSGTATGTGTIA